MSSTWNSGNSATGTGSDTGVPATEIQTPNNITPSTTTGVIGIAPVKIPNSPVDTTTLPATIGALQQQNQAQVEAAQNKDTTAETAKNQTLDTIKNLSMQLGGQSGDQATAEANAGLPGMNKELSDLTALGSQQTAQYLNKINALNAGGTGTTGGVSAAETATTRQHAIDALMTNSLIQAKQGNITYAQNLVDKAIAAKYDPIKAQIKTNQDFLDANYKDLSRADQKLADAQSAKNTLALKQADDLSKMQNDSIKTLLSNGAPQDVIQNVLKAGSTADIMKAGGQYLATSNVEFQKVGDTLYRIDKNTGKVLNTYGAPLTSSTGDPVTVTRTVDTPTGKVAVDSYSLIAGDDPYFIAQKNGIDMQTLQKLNPQVSDWTKLQPGAILNVPSKDIGSGAITAVANIPLINFNYLTQGTSALTRMGAADRARIMKESDAFLKKNGLDYSTFQSRYKSYNKVLGDNIERANNTNIFGGEVTQTADQFVNDIGNDLGKLKLANVSALWAGKQVNDPLTQKYAFDLLTMRNDLAGYYAASRGSKDPDDADKKTAEAVLGDGINKGSIEAFRDSIVKNEQKVTGVVNRAVDSSNKQIWDLFGVGDKYHSPVAPKPKEEDSFLSKFAQSNKSNTIMDTTTQLKTAIDFAKQNPDDPKSVQLRQRIESGMYNNELKQLQANTEKAKQTSTLQGKLQSEDTGYISGMGARTGQEQVAGANKIASSVKTGSEDLQKGIDIAKQGGASNVLKGAAKGVQGLAEGGFGTVSGAAQAAFAPVTAAVSPVIKAELPAVGKVLGFMNPGAKMIYDNLAPQVKQALEPKLQEVVDKHPNATGLAGDIINTLLLGIGGGATEGAVKESVGNALTKDALNASKESILNTPNAVKTAIVGTPEKQIAKQVQNAVDSVTPELSGKKLTGAYKQVMTGERTVKPSSVFSDQKLSPDQQTELLGARLKNIVSSKSPLKNLDSLHKELTSTEAKIQSAFDAHGNDFPANKPVLAAKLEEIKSTIPREFSSIRDSKSVFNNTIDFGKELLSKAEDTPRGLRKARQAFDKQAQLEYPSAFKDGGAMDLKTPAGRAIREVRDAFNQHLYETAPDGSEIKGLVGHEADLYRANEQVAAKAQKLEGATKLKQWMIKNPGKVKALIYTGIGLGITGAGKGVQAATGL